MNKKTTNPFAQARASVAIVAPSGYAPHPHEVERAIGRLQAAGCQVRDFSASAPTHQRFGADDGARVAQLHAAAADPDVNIVLALRGGYGMSRLLPQLDLAALGASGKRFVGHSDFTALQMALLAQAGVASFAGPMVCRDFAPDHPSDFTPDNFLQCPRSPPHTVPFYPHGQPSGAPRCHPCGGNPEHPPPPSGPRYLPAIEGGILFIEDINEHPYRVERMLLQLFHAGHLNQKAIVFGDFSGYRLTDYDNGYDFAAMRDYLRRTLGIPLLTGLPFGHIRDKATLVVGSHAHLQSEGGSCTLTMSGYPALLL